MRLIGLKKTQIRRRIHCTMDGVTETVISAVVTIVSIYTMNMTATTATATTMMAMIMISMGSKMLYWEFIVQKYFSIADMI
jgi:predicted phage tail protein